jgi:hypothetical protein
MGSSLSLQSRQADAPRHRFRKDERHSVHGPGRAIRGAAGRVAGESGPGPIEARILRWPSQSPDGKGSRRRLGRVWLQRFREKASISPPADSRLVRLPGREYAPDCRTARDRVRDLSDAEGGHLWKARSALRPLRRDAGQADSGSGALRNPDGLRSRIDWSAARLGLEFRGQQPEQEELRFGGSPRTEERLTT